MKKLIASLIIGLGVMHGAQAATQTQTFDFTVAADSEGVFLSKTWGAFDTRLGFLTDVEVSYNFSNTLNYTITNTSSSVVSSLNVSAVGGEVAMAWRFGESPFVYVPSVQLAGGNSYFIPPGATVSDSIVAQGKGIDLYSAMTQPEFGFGATTEFVVTTPFATVGGRGLRGLTFSTNSEDLQGSMSLTYIYEAAPVPEPESYAMMLAGLSLIGTMVARRKVR